jgi:hypothetical protein
MLEVVVEFKAVVSRNRKTFRNYGSKAILRKGQRHPKLYFGKAKES